MTISDDNAKKPTQVVYVWNYTNWGGAQIYFFGLMQEAKKRFQLAALIPEHSPKRIFDQLDQLSVAYKYLEADQAAVKPESISAKVALHAKWAEGERKLVRQLARDFDLGNSIVHIDLGFWQSSFTLFRLSLKTHVFVTIHTALPKVNAGRRLVWRIKGKLLSRLKNFHLLASNEDARRSLAPYLSAAKYREVKVAYSGIDKREIESFAGTDADREAICSRYGLDPARPMIISLGQFIERKGCWIALEALRNVVVQHPGVQFLWMGTSDPDPQTVERIAGYGLSRNFRLITSEEIGPTRKNVLELLSIADIFVLASFEEGLPIALVEAMALEKACIATRINAIPEAIEDGIEGLLIKSGSASELATAIETLLVQPDLRNRLGRNAKIKAFSSFDARQGAETTVRAYERALSRRQSNL